LLKKSHSRTKKTKSNEDIEEVFSINVRTKYKVKYLHFDPKVFRRPPYYGTWRQKSKFVKPRRPFAKDEVGVYLYFLNIISDLRTFIIYYYSLIENIKL
jgi:hypothetical protein